MEQILLMLLLSTPANPTPYQPDGFKPRAAESMDVCLRRRSEASRYMDENAGPGVKYLWFCVSMHAHGYEEALEAFSQTLGDPA